MGEWPTSAVRAKAAQFSEPQLAEGSANYDSVEESQVGLIPVVPVSFSIERVRKYAKLPRKNFSKGVMHMNKPERIAFSIALGLACGLFMGLLAFAQAQPDFAVLKSRWFRTDGVYVIDIRSVDASGRMQAAYYNPNPINVARAEASRSGAAVTVFIELRAPGYPGSTYTLIHDPKRDELKGVYHHAGLQQNFEVVFARGK